MPVSRSVRWVGVSIQQRRSHMLFHNSKGMEKVFCWINCSKSILQDFNKALFSKREQQWTEPRSSQNDNDEHESKDSNQGMHSNQSTRTTVTLQGIDYHKGGVQSTHFLHVQPLLLYCKSKQAQNLSHNKATLYTQYHAKTWKQRLSKNILQSICKRYFFLMSGDIPCKIGTIWLPLHFFHISITHHHCQWWV